MAKEPVKHPKNCKCKDCKKKMVKESTNIVNFIKNVTEKNYAEANKYLRLAVSDKLKGKIAQCANVKPF